MGQVDASMTQILLPKLERNFDAQLSTVSWVAVAYLLSIASFMPIFGRLADMFGRKSHVGLVLGFLDEPAQSGAGEARSRTGPNPG